MASIIPGYNYDIFISYRQKDNKGDRWVSEFVDALKDELESTFKEEITVYFDINQHDGLLETHDVDASLKEKLKCLVFIPIISRTYCDPKSFAWEHEFKAFVGHASEDQFGLKVKLPDGSMTNRVLPLRIHDLDDDDLKLCESVMGGVPEGVEFIYKSPGVNRPLRSKEDKPQENFNKTIYRDQVNKTALAINEIILGLKGEQGISVKVGSDGREHKQKFNEAGKHARSMKYKFLIGTGILALLIIAGIFAYPKLFKKNNLGRLISKDGRISIAVMPFQNMTNDTTWNDWQSGIQNILISSLANSRELQVRQLKTLTNMLQSRDITDYSSLTPSVVSSISKKLETNVYITGSIKQSDTTVRLNAQLIDTKSGKAFESFQIEGTADNVFPIIESLSVRIQEFLLVSVLKKELNSDETHWAVTRSPEALLYYMKGQDAFEIDFSAARDWYLKAVDEDSNFVDAAVQLSLSYLYNGEPEQGKQLCLKYYKKKDLMPMLQRIIISYCHAFLFETPLEQIQYLKQFQEFDDLLPTYYYLTGVAYFNIEQYDKAIPELEKSLKLQFKLNSSPEWPEYYSMLVWAYLKNGQYKKARKILNKSEKYFPDDLDLTQLKVIISLVEGDTVEANLHIKKYLAVRSGTSTSKSAVASILAQLYNHAGLYDKAEEYFHKALILDPENFGRMNVLAWFLIDKDRNINEALELANMSLKISPDNFYALHFKGWGLLKMGNNEEALELLEKADSLKTIYNHPLYIHLLEARKTVAGQK